MEEKVTPVFVNEYKKMGEVRDAIMKQVLARPTPTASNLARQILDHLDASYLFLQQFDGYLSTVDEATEKAAADAMAKGKVLNFPKSE